jgi:acyl phosphate:glycerol-3-phosphate acyltransferase
MQLGYLAVFYLIGSIPVAWLVAKLAGDEDIREQGSGNAGVMNVAINVSRLAGLIVFLAEAAKGAISVVLTERWQLSDWMVGLAVVAAVAGTRWSIWLYGKGGRGNTLGVAALLVLAWQAVVVSLGVWVLARILTRSSFWATRCWLLALPLTLGLVTMSWAYAIMGALLAVIYLSMHNTETDDHAMIKKTYPSLWAFLTTPPRRKKSTTGETRESLMNADIKK